MHGLHLETFLESDLARGRQWRGGGRTAARDLAPTSEEESHDLFDRLLQAGLSDVVTHILLLLDPPSMQQAKQVKTEEIKHLQQRCVAGV